MNKPARPSPHSGSTQTLTDRVCVQLLCSKHSVFCLWEVRWKDDLPSCLQCVFSANFCPPDQDVSALKPFHYQFQLERVTVRPARVVLLP